MSKSIFSFVAAALTSFRKFGAETSSSPRARLWAFSAVRTKVRAGTPGISIGYWNDRNGRALGGLQTQQVLALPGHAAVGRLIARPSGHGIAQGRLAGPVRPHDGVHLARRNVERQAFEDRLVADGNVEVGDGEH